MKEKAKRTEKFRKFALCTVNVILVGVFCYCIWVATFKYLGSKRGIVITQRQLNTVQFPSVKVCRTAPIGFKVEKDFPLIGAAMQEVTIDNVTRKTNLSNDTELKELGIQVAWKHFSLPNGPRKIFCTVLHSQGKVGIGGYVRFKL